MPLPPDATSRQRPPTFRGLSRILVLWGCGVGAATLWRDVQAVAPGLARDPQAALPPWVAGDEPRLSIGGQKRLVAVVLGPKGERLDLRPGGPGPEGDGIGPAAMRRAQAAHRGATHPGPR